MPVPRRTAAAVAVDTVMTDTVGEFRQLACDCHPRGDRPFAMDRGKRRDSAGLRAHAGCVWCVTVKDPRRLLGNAASPTVQPALRASPSRAGAARSGFLDVENPRGSSDFHVENGAMLLPTIDRQNVQKSGLR